MNKLLEEHTKITKNYPRPRTDKVRDDDVLLSYSGDEDSKAARMSSQLLLCQPTLESIQMPRGKAGA